VVQELEEPEADEEGGWMTTFADLMSLLLTFFILLLSFANMDVIKFKDAQGSLQEAFGVQFDDTIKGTHRTMAASIVELSHVTKDSVLDLELESRQAHSAIQSVVNARMKANENIYKRLQAIVRDLNLGDQVVVENTSKGVVITVNGQLFFHSGSSILKKESFPLLNSITNIIEEFPYKLNIEGHTDSTLIKTSEFPSNWELSAGRAISAVKYILSSGKIEAEKLGASGYAETRPIAQNDTAEGRRINRRIEFVFFREEMEIKEFTDFRPEEEEDDINAEGVEGEPSEEPQASPAEGEPTPLEGKTSGDATKDTTDSTGATPSDATASEELGSKQGHELENAEVKTIDATEATPNTEVAPAAVPSKTDDAMPTQPVPTTKKPAQSEAVKKGILKPINILSPIAVAPESIEKPTTESSPPAAPTKAKGTPTITTPPASTEPAVPGKFSAPTD
jgi:chemotaxis protein MotB